MLLLLLGCTRPAPPDKPGGGPDTAPVDSAAEDTAVDTADTRPGDTAETGAPCEALRWYADRDGDTYGDPATFEDACEAPDASWVTTAADCDDTAADVHPSAADVCGDGRDANCDGADTCAWSGEIDLGTQIKLTAPEPASEAGRLAEVGEITGDGVPDLLIATFGRDGYAGGAWIAPGPITRSASLDTVGHALVGDRDTTYGAGRAIGLGDLDGDGVGDVAIGVPYYQNALYVFRGPVTGSLRVDAPDHILQGPAGTYAAHGADVADVNGDGLDDAIVGAYLNPDPVAGAGTVYVSYGPLESDVHLPSSADVVLPGAEATAYTGRHITAGGDVDGDGLGDFLVAAPGATGGAPTSGVVYVVRGPGDIGDMRAADGRLLGESAASALGIGAAMAFGDLDGDGLDDVAAGAYYEGGSVSYGGAAYVVRGPAAGDHDLAAADLAVHGTETNQYAGASVAIGDVDRDGVADFVVGASGTDTSTGCAYVYSAPAWGGHRPSDADARFVGEDLIAFAGAFTTFGDVTGDGRADLLIGATGEATGGFGAGAVYVVTP